MKTIIAILALCAFAPGALAAGTDCRTVESNSVRLASEVSDGVLRFRTT